MPHEGTLLKYAGFVYVGRLQDWAISRQKKHESEKHYIKN